MGPLCWIMECWPPLSVRRSFRRMLRSPEMDGCSPCSLATLPSEVWQVGPPLNFAQYNLTTLCSVSLKPRHKHGSFRFVVLNSIWWKLLETKMKVTRINIKPVSVFCRRLCGKIKLNIRVGSYKFLPMLVGREPARFLRPFVVLTAVFIYPVMYCFVFTASNRLRV